MPRNRRKHILKNKNNNMKAPQPTSARNAAKQSPSKEKTSSSTAETPTRRQGLTTSEAYARITDVMVKLTSHCVFTQEGSSADISQEVPYSQTPITDFGPLDIAARIAPPAGAIAMLDAIKDKGKLPVRNFPAVAGAAGKGEGEGEGKGDEETDEDEDDDEDDDDDDDDEDESEDEDDSSSDNYPNEVPPLEDLDPFPNPTSSLSTWRYACRILSNKTHFNVMMHKYDPLVKSMRSKHKPRPEERFAVRNLAKTTEIEQGLADLRQLLMECHRTEDDMALEGLVERIRGAVQGLSGEGGSGDDGDAVEAG